MNKINLELMIIKYYHIPINNPPPEERKISLFLKEGLSEDYFKMYEKKLECNIIKLV